MTSVSSLPESPWGGHGHEGGVDGAQKGCLCTPQTAASFWLKPWGERISFLSRMAELVGCDPRKARQRAGQGGTSGDIFFFCNATLKNITEPDMAQL